MTADQVRGLMRKRIDKAGSAKAWADEIKVSPSYISDVLTDKREPGESILKALGVERQVIYRRLQAH